MSLKDAPIIRSLDEELHNFDHTVDTTRDQRRDIVDMSLKIAKKIDVQGMNASNPKEIEAAAKAINVALKALNEVDASANRSVNAKLRHQEQQKDTAVSEQVVELLKRFNAGDISPAAAGITVDLTKTSQEINESLKSGGVIITPEECREDPNDLS